MDVSDVLEGLDVPVGTSLCWLSPLKQSASVACRFLLHAVAFHNILVIFLLRKLLFVSPKIHMIELSYILRDRRKEPAYPDN